LSPLSERTDAGLAAYVYSRDVGRVMRVSRELEFGMVGANGVGLSDAATPFGGFKESGLGREGGFDGLEAYTECKFVSIGFGALPTEGDGVKVAEREGEGGDDDVGNTV